MNYKLSDNYEAMYHGAINAGIQYLLKYKSIKSLVIGVSGGIDSTVACMLAKAVCIKLTDRKVTLIGKSIAIDSNTDDEIKRAKKVGKSFCDGFEHINLTEQWKKVANAIERGLGGLSKDQFDRNLKIRAGNTKARFRMMYLYNLASKNNGLVLSTDNLTEYMLGFWTLHGDVGDFGFIQNLWKTEVYGLANWWVGNSKDGEDDEQSGTLLSCVDAVPTDGLGITDSDLDQLLHHWPIKSGHIKGYAYVDELLIKYLSSKSYNKGSSVIERHLDTQFKRNNPVSVNRCFLIP